MSSVRARQRRDRVMRLILWGAIILFLIGAWLCFHPIIWESDDRVMPGTTVLLKDAVSDFLIVVDYEEFEPNPARFDAMDFSLAWLNTLQQEIGPVSLVDADGFTDADLSKYRCVIITRSAASHDAWVPKLRSYLERGGNLILEMPTGALRTIASADGKGGLRNAQNVTYVAGVSEKLQSAFSTLDLSNRTQVIGSAGPLEDSKTFLTIDGVPAIYAKSYATGHVITLDFNYGMLLTSLQQGRPLDNFSVRNLYDSTAFETSDLSFTGDNSAEVPLADAFERFLFYGVIDSIFPVTGFWPFYDGMMGTFLVTHHEKGIGDLAVWMPEYEATFKATSTMFVESPAALTDDGINKLHDFRTEVGLAFNLTSSAQAIVPVGPFAFSPVWRRLNLAEQTKSLKDTLGENYKLLSSQSKDGNWDSHFTRPFRALAAAGFNADASYRAPFDKPGYAFLTGLPFMPIDTNGKIFNLLEFPITYPTVKNEEDVERISSALELSQNDYHECLSVAFEPSFFLDHPDLETYRAWKKLYRIASDHEHWVTGIQSFFRFTTARFNAELKSRESSLANNKKSRVLRLETLAPENGMMISVPASSGSRKFVEARRGVHRVREDALLTDILSAKTVTIFGFERVLVPLSKGFNAIDVVYE